MTDFTSRAAGFHRRGIMKDQRDDIYLDMDSKKMLASNLAASLNIPPDITITAVSVPAKPLTPPPAPKHANRNSIHSNSKNPTVPMNLMVSSPQIINNQSPLNLNAANNLESNPMNMSLGSPNYQPTNPSCINSQNIDNQNAPKGLPPAPGNSKYSQLLDVIEEIGKDVRPTYSGSKSSAERLRRSIGLARILIRQCIMETEPNIKQ